MMLLIHELRLVALMLALSGNLSSEFSKIKHI